MNLKTSLIALAAFAVGLVPVFANPQVKMGTYNAGSGGNYRADPNAELEYVLNNYVVGKSTDGTYFGTFCIEKNEYFSNGGTYDVVLNNGSVNGGVTSPTVGFDVISQGTAYLYKQFATGMLSASYYGSATNAAKLQNLFWWLEGEQTSYGTGSAYTSLLSDQFGANWMVDAKTDYTGSEVKVMNLTSNRGRTLNQDQLVYLGVPDAGTTALLLGLGLLSLSFVKRKERQA